MQGSFLLYCDICGAANRPQARFCFACGRPLQHGTPSALGPGQVQAPPPRTTTTAPVSPTTTGLLPSNASLRGRYQITAQVGKGGFGAVYRATDLMLARRTLAIKEMSQQSLSSRELQEATAAFQQEALLLAGLIHPNLPRIYDHFCENGRWYLVMDFIEGETLEERLSHIPDGRLPLDEVLRLGLQLCEVLGYLHSRQPPIIFRDLKPANIMLTREGHLYLIDFGIARLFKPGQSRDTTALGSAGYAAPEQYGRAQSTPQTDIYALGATLHQLITGQDPSLSPFTFAPFPQQDADHRRLEALVMRMVQTEASHRPGSIQEIKAELESLLARRLSSQGRPSASPYRPAPASASTVAPVVAPPTAPLITRCLYTGHRRNSSIYTLAWSPDGRLLASSGADGSVQIWEALSGHLLQRCDGHRGPVYGLAWSPDGQRLASAGRDGTVRLWNPSTGNELTSYQGHTSCVYSVAWAPDGQLLASASDDATVRVWTATSPWESSSYRGHRRSVKAVAWAPDSQRLASGGSDGLLHIWARPANRGRSFLTSWLLSRKEVHCYGQQRRINAIAWSRGGRYVAAGKTGGSVEIWESQHGRQQITYRRHKGAVYALSWRPQGSLLASGGRDGHVHCWQAIDGQQRFTYNSQQGIIYSLAWSPDGRYLACGGQDGSVYVWEIN
ncbi:WD40 repeat domain-containing serine/threonine-protein kinase [Thermogemmatispora onikobensis]|uniref:WD40 repeat domain-containing serine/threonine-protein kinase n=1 Tax=Thermogemmatispora onikobensis TaxID=732234 RepID=UPI000A015BB9|nr:WD40 repeat domain-containing serine/threonine-protein kinase [Thermogemmatispora onikobensis]